VESEDSRLLPRPSVLVRDSQTLKMSYLVVARKWRPQNFEDVAGQNHITRTLQNAIRANRIAHAYLFTGVRGVGKTTAARILAKALNCENGPVATPCNQCSVCEAIASGNCIDVFEIDGASNRGIDEVRQIIDNVRYQPAKCRFKIYIIDEVHQVTRDAFNALLKTLEEPPPSVKFILATTEPHRLPETILSRCQRYNFRRIGLREIVDRLAEIAKHEALAITEGALALLAREADGSMRDAQSLLEQVLAGSGSASPVDERALHELLGIAERGALYELSSAVIAGDARRCLHWVAAVAADARDLCRLSRDLVEHFRNLMVARLAVQAKGSDNSGALLDLPDQEIVDLKGQADALALETLVDYYDFMAAGDEEVARSPNPRFALEAVLVKLALLPKSLPVGDLVERLERLEQQLAVGPSLSGAAAKSVSAVAMAAGCQTADARTAMASVNAAIPAEPASPPTLPVNMGDKGAVWREFIATVRQERKFLASYLDGAQLLELLPGSLCIGVAERLELSSLQDPENLGALKDIAKRFFTEDVVIEVKLLADRAPEQESQPPGGAVANSADRWTDRVNETLRIFPGSSVRSVRRE
jgi:DNA polymerase III subunit gamma/tau